MTAKEKLQKSEDLLDKTTKELVINTARLYLVKERGLDKKEAKKRCPDMETAERILALSEEFSFNLAS